MATKTYIDVAYKDRDLAKRLGARWDPSVKRWYCPSGSTLALIYKWRKAPTPGEMESKAVTGGNCIFADDDVARLRALAMEAEGLTAALTELLFDTSVGGEYTTIIAKNEVVDRAFTLLSGREAAARQALAAKGGES